MQRVYPLDTRFQEQGSPDMRYAEVYVDQYYRDRPLSYRVPDELQEALRSGCRVLVSRKEEGGKSGTDRLGFVTRLSHTATTEISGDILDIFDDGEPVLSETLLRLAEWISDYYLSWPIEAIHAALPAVLRVHPKETVCLKEFQLIASDEKLIRTALRKRIMQELGREPKLSVGQLERRTGSKYLHYALGELQRAGYVEVKKTFVQKGKPKLKTAYRLSKAYSPAEIEAALESLKRTKKQSEVFQKILSLPAPLFFREDIDASLTTLQALVNRGLLFTEQIEVTRRFNDGFSEEKKHISLTNEQAFAVANITGALDSSAFKTLLLHGITGSGKTWVYIEALRHALSSGKTAIVLVPEISLTPQTASRFRHHFGDQIRVLHSGMSDSEKYEAWQSLRQGKAQIALGPRSAVFAPLSNVGLIIVDEEHESSYKQYDKSPRYNGRDIAIMRAKFENAVCLLGSATPSIESYQNAISGKYDLLTLSKRADEASVPELKLIHLPKDRRVSSSISETLYTEIKKRLERHEQVILFQNRRGFSGSVQCKECGHIYKCPDCNVPMVYHLREHHLRCHYCGRTADMIERCPACGSEALAYKSSGTERIEQELQQLFPTEKILRMDLDTTTKKGSHSKILQSFRDSKASILLGTQMVAKGLDFPNVTLVGVLLADIGLTLPDFRANERLYSLLLQVAGRAGRSQKKGEVFLQVYNLDNDLFRLLLLGNYEQFFSYESEIRQMLSYPPYARLAKIEFSGPEEHRVNESAQFFLKQLCANIDTENFEILGPVPAVLAKLKGKYRYQIIIKQKNGARLTKAILRGTQFLFWKEWGQKHKIKLDIDIDTQSIL